jgi:hypothetical protein
MRESLARRFIEVLSLISIPSLAFGQVSDAMVPASEGVSTGPRRSCSRPPMLSSTSKADVRQEAFARIHGQAAAATFVKDVANFKQQIKAQQRFTRCVLLPGRNSKKLNIWDGITGLALIYTATMTPFEAAFLQTTIGVAAFRDPWFLLNRLLDLIFTLDMLLNFFLAYQTVDSQGGTVWVADQRKVAAHYLRGFFFFDASTIFVPLSFDLSIAATPTVGGEAVGGFADSATIVRTLRIIRLTKLARLVRASRLYTRWQAKITLSTSSQTILTCALLLLIGAHWYACIIGMQAALHITPQETFLGPDRYGYCADADDGGGVGGGGGGGVGGGVGVGGGALAGCPTMGLWSWYVASFTWAVLIITGTGGTEYLPNSASDPETLLVCCMVVCGALLWTYVLALFATWRPTQTQASRSFGSSSMASTPTLRRTVSPRTWRGAFANIFTSRRRGSSQSSQSAACPCCRPRCRSRSCCTSTACGSGRHGSCATSSRRASSG